MPTLYIQRRDGRELETVDSVDSAEYPNPRREAGRLLREYRQADGSALYYVSRRPTAAWRLAEREASRPSRVEPAGSLLAFHDGFGGLRPCRILSARSDVAGAIMFDVRFTGPSDPYARGTVHTFPSRFIVPRGAIRRSGGCTYVRRYDWRTAGFPELASLRHTGPDSGRWQGGANMAPDAVTAAELAPLSPRAEHARALSRAMARDAAERGARP
jgi:hypothetical protein